MAIGRGRPSRSQAARLGTGPSGVRLLHAQASVLECNPCHPTPDANGERRSSRTTGLTRTCVVARACSSTRCRQRRHNRCCGTSSHGLRIRRCSTWVAGTGCGSERSPDGCRTESWSVSTSRPACSPRWANVIRRCRACAPTDRCCRCVTTPSTVSSPHGCFITCPTSALCSRRSAA